MTSTVETEERHAAAAPGAGAGGGEGGELPELVIRARRGWVAIDWAELLHYRELLYFLVWRDVKVRYKQTVLGVAWALLQPLFQIVVFSVIFGRLADMKSETGGMPYAVFVCVGTLPWMFFSNGVSQAGLSLLSQQHLLTKVYFPRLMVPASCFGAAAVDMLLSMSVLVGVMAWYQVWPAWGIVLLPALMALTAMAGLGVGLILAALTVTYRDFRFVIPFMIQAWMFLSPVVYPVTFVPKWMQWVLLFNPMSGIIGAYRSAILGARWEFGPLGISAGTGAAILVFGLYYFKKVERRFADIA